ncbi:NADPH:quinone oxidoreductase family protein [Elongatibacter sediminis]|uniref:NADPH:quinone oxidoreductase family protein n=1 Tax=Elongatibacter sediminis TaxID=3119006 RepID=A0AAW9REJ3_9GAMM
MRAWFVTRVGEPARVLELREANEPLPGTGEVTIATDAVGLNFLDVMACRGSYPWNPAPPFIPCAELVGHIQGVHDGSRFQSGQRVVAMIPAAHGALAETCSVPQNYVFPVSGDIADEAAAAMLVTYQTAWFALERAAVKAGDTVLIHGGAGGVGTAATQLCRLRGARVIATAGSEAKLDICRNQGAELAINYRSQDFVAEVRAHTAERGVDVVLDQVGGTVSERSLEALAFEGRLVLVGWASGEAPNLDAQSLVMRNHTVIGLSWGSTYPLRDPDRVRDAHATIHQAIQSKQITPHIHATVPFEDAPDMMQALGDGKTTGKAVIRIR